MSTRHSRGHRIARLLALIGAGVTAGCTHTVKVEPIKVEPIDITLHIHLEADQKLDAFFDDVDSKPKPAASSEKDAASETNATGGKGDKS